MKQRRASTAALLVAFGLAPAVGFTQTGQEMAKPISREQRALEAMHSVSSHELLAYVEKLCSKEYGGRLTGTAGYRKAAKSVVTLLEEWGVLPAGDNGTYLQSFPNPYTLVLPGSELALYLPVEKGASIKKEYRYEMDYLQGSTSGSGDVTAEVVYVGYGITAPELGFDEYEGLDVKGKIVLVEPEVPISPGDEPEEFKKWRPYSFHQYKVINAAKHGAAGMIYDYHIANPNCVYIEDLVLTYVAQSVVDDVFAGTGREHKKTKQSIADTRKPHSFSTGKTFRVKNTTKHYPEGVAQNVLGIIEGSDPKLREEAVILAAHLDHLGYNHEMMPGANDNASGVAVVLGVAKALTEHSLAPKRTVLLALFGAEEQGVRGSDFYLQQPVFPPDKVFGLLNLDSVGRGTKIRARAGKRFPDLWSYIDAANRAYVHRVVEPTDFHNLARPRLDAAHFMWAGIPSISFGTSGAPELPYPIYHKTFDTPETITPEIMEDMGRILLMALLEM